MVLTIIIVIIGIVGIFLQFKYDDLKDKPEKKRIGKIFIIVSIALLIGNNIQNFVSSDQLEGKVENLDSTNKDLNNNISKIENDLTILQSKYDSLYKLHLETQELLYFANSQIFTLQKNTQSGLKDNAEAIDKIERIKVSDKRTITKLQKNLMLNELYPGKGSEIVIASVNAGESLMFSKEIQDIFREAGWKVSGDEIWLAAGAQYKGFFLFSQDRNETKKIISACRALRVLNPNFQINVDPKLPKGIAKIVVGYN